MVTAALGPRGPWEAASAVTRTGQPRRPWSIGRAVLCHPPVTRRISAVQGVCLQTGGPRATHAAGFHRKSSPRRIAHRLQ